MEHAKFSPSSAHRWLNCTASPMMEVGKPDSPTKASATGTIYHAVAELAMTKLLDVYEDDSLGDKTASHPSENTIAREVDAAFSRVLNTPLSFMSKRDAAFIDDADVEVCVEAVVPYIVDTFDLFDDLRNVRPEARVYPLPALENDLYGTVDFHGIENSVLHVVDLKTGRYPVSPNDNPQLKTYALGAMQEYDAKVNEVRLYVHQGGELVGPWTIEAGDLLEHATALSRAIKKGRTGGEFKTGEHCRWCKAKTDCGAYADRALDIARDEFDVPVVADGTVDGASMMTTFENMTGDDLAMVFERYALIEQMVKVAHEVATRRAYDDGLDVPGFKLVRGVKHKAWLDVSVTAKKLGDGAYKSQLITPAQAIKKFGSEATDGLWHVPEGDLKIVPESAKGKPVTPAALGEFNDDA